MKVKLPTPVHVIRPLFKGPSRSEDCRFCVRDSGVRVKNLHLMLGTAWIILTRERQTRGTAATKRMQTWASV
jgi:hypothetical protein